ncbi:MAG: hypothetical protein HFG27_04990 [Provencibacterium sp.]|nr:hypothetical protein [Provencibacterium sp.]
MKKWKTIGWLAVISAAIFFCLQAGALADESAAFTGKNSFSLQNVVWKEESPVPAAKKGYYQLGAGVGQGSITFFNDGYSHLSVTGYTESASFTSWRGNQPVRGYTSINLGSLEILRLRYDTGRHLLMACDGQEVFCVYPDSSAADGSGYSCASLFGILSADAFSRFPYYGISLEFSKDGRLFEPLPSEYLLTALEESAKLTYQEKHSASVPKDAVWLRISLSYAKELKNSEGTIFVNHQECPIKISGIRCTPSHAEGPFVSSSQPISSSSGNADSSSSLPPVSSSSVPDISSSVSSGENDVTYVPSEEENEGNKAENTSSSSKPSVYLDITSSKTSGGESDSFDSSKKQHSFGKVEREPIQDARENAFTAAPFSGPSADDSMLEDSLEGSLEGKEASAAEEGLLKAELSPCSAQKPESKAESLAAEEAMDKTISSDLSPAGPENLQEQAESRETSGFLLLYLAGVLFAGAFWAGRISTRSHKFKK